MGRAVERTGSPAGILSPVDEAVAELLFVAAR